MAPAPERCLSRRGAFKAENVMMDAERAAEAANRLRLRASFSAQAVIYGEGVEGSPLPRRPAMGKAQKRKGIAAPGDSHANRRIKQAFRQRRQRCREGGRRA